jgi:3-polyprenyl-4-hydroxybenzoate decarboxylase
VEARVDLHLEVTEIRRPVIADGRPAPLFTNVPRVKRSDGPFNFRIGSLNATSSSRAKIRVMLLASQQNPARLWRWRLHS